MDNLHSFEFMRLPLELRQLVYSNHFDGFVFDGDCADDLRKLKDGKRMSCKAMTKLPALMYASHAIREEAMLSLLRSCIFEFDKQAPVWEISKPKIQFEKMQKYMERVHHLTITEHVLSASIFVGVCRLYSVVLDPFTDSQLANTTNLQIIFIQVRADWGTDTTFQLHNDFIPRFAALRQLRQVRLVNGHTADNANESHYWPSRQELQKIGRRLQRLLKDGLAAVGRAEIDVDW